MAYFRAGTARATHEAQQITVAKTPLASFESNVSGLYLPEILAYIQASQSGTGNPSPSNIRPISGVDSLYVTRTGVNLWDEISEIGNINNTTGQNQVYGTNRIRSKNYIPVYPTLNMCVVNSNTVPIYLYCYGRDQSYIGLYSSTGITGTSIITIPSDCYFIRFRSNDNYGDTIGKISFNYPSTATSYEQFKGDPYIKFFDGLIKGTYGYIDLSNIASFSYDGVSKRWQSMITGIYNFPSRNGDLVAEKYVADITATTGDENKMFTVGGAIYIYSTDSTTPPSGKLIYPLATPTTPTITPIEINMLQSAFGTEGTSAYIMLGGTYYGGYLNVTTGLLTVTHRFQALDALSWTKNGSTITFYSETLTGLQGETDDFYCSCYLPTINGGYNGQNGKISIKASNDTSRIWVADNSYSTSEDFKASLTGQTAVLKLSTPIEVQLTPAQIEQLLGQNNVFCSTGDVAVKYWKID